MPQVQVTVAFGASGPVDSVNQKWVVIVGLMKARKTTSTGLRISMPVVATGGPVVLTSSSSSRTCFRYVQPQSNTSFIAMQPTGYTSVLKGDSDQANMADA